MLWSLFMLCIAFISSREIGESLTAERCCYSRCMYGDHCVTYEIPKKGQTDIDSQLQALYSAMQCCFSIASKVKGVNIDLVSVYFRLHVSVSILKMKNSLHILDKVCQVHTSLCSQSIFVDEDENIAEGPNMNMIILTKEGELVVSYLCLPASTLFPSWLEFLILILSKSAEAIWKPYWQLTLLIAGRSHFQGA